jgi:hypothetical protein
LSFEASKQYLKPTKFIFKSAAEHSSNKNNFCSSFSITNFYSLLVICISLLPSLFYLLNKIIKMNSKFLILVSLLISSFCLIQGLSSSNIYGATVQVSANTATNITFGTLEPTSLEINSNEDVSVTLNAVANLDVQLPQGLTSLTTSVGLAFELVFETSGSGQLDVTTTVTTPAIDTSFFSGSTLVGAGVFQLQDNVYGRINIDSITASKQLVFTLPSSALQNNKVTWVIASISTGSLIPSFFNRLYTLASNVEQKLTFGESLNVSVTTPSGNSITVSQSTTNPYGVDPSGYVAVSTYFTVTLDDETQKIDGTLYALYDDALVVSSGLSEAIQFAFYNTTTSAWQFVATQVDTTHAVVTVNTDHFSTWAAYSSSAAVTDDNSSSSASALVYSTAVLLSLIGFLLF